MVAEVLELMPQSHGLKITTQPIIQPRITAEMPPRLQQLTNNNEIFQSTSSDPQRSLTVSPNLSSIEVEALVREKVRSTLSPLQQAFQSYDVDQSASVTKGEFRRVIELYCLPLTTEQFNAILAKVETNSNGTVRYCDFLDKFYGGKTFSQSESKEKLSSTKLKKSQMVVPSDVNTDMLEVLIKDKVVKNAKNLVKAFRLFDYNHDGKIQQHELRRVLENYCFKLTDQQFNKLWQRHDFHHTGLINYNDFLKRIGVVVTAKTMNEEAPRTSMSWKDAELKCKVVQTQGKNRMIQEQLRGKSFNEIDSEFRRLMKVNYMDLKKACMLVDHHLDGWMSLDDLHNILSQFTIPLTDQLFSKLTDNLGIKASGRVQWEHFLEKFQDPQGAYNGQTIPIKPGHKYFPLRGGDEVLKADEILKLLEQHVNCNYSSIKQAFLQFDSNRDGLVTRRELRRVIERFTFRLTDAQFKDLMILLDPQHAGRISYQAFLDLFERQESLAGHKWLNSVHRVNDRSKPIVMAWKTVEDILREKIEYNWKEMRSDLLKYDPFKSYIISTNQLRSLINRYAIPVSNEHFDFLLATYRDKCGHQDTSNAVNYKQFFNLINVTVMPGDINGLSQQIQEGSEMTSEKREADLENRQAQMVTHATDRVKFMTADDVIKCLQDRMARHDIHIRQSFLAFVNNNKSTITKKSFRNGLASFGMYLTDANFAELASRLGFQRGPLDYYDFVDKFDTPTCELCPGVVEHPCNHRVNEIRGLQMGSMTAMEAELSLRRKLREKFDNLRQAFYKIDTDHNGVVTKANIRYLLDLFMIDINNEEFNKLCASFNITAKSRLTYSDFLDRFEVREGMCGDSHTLLSNPRSFEHKDSGLMKADDVYKVLCHRIYDQWHSLSQAFLTIDKGGKGVIKRRQLRRLLHHFSLHLSSDEFKKLWSMFDMKGQGYLTSDEFISKIRGTEYGAGDAEGLSKRIIEESDQTLDSHLVNQEVKQDIITVNQANLGQGLRAETVVQDLRDKIRDKYVDFYMAFRKYDTNCRGYINITDIHHVLTDLHYFLNHDEFYRLLDMHKNRYLTGAIIMCDMEINIKLNNLGLKTDNRRLDYDLFLKAFEEGRKSSYGKREIGEVKIVDYRGLKNEDAEVKMGEKVACQYEALTKAFAVFDRQQTGTLCQSDFRRVLDLFCFKLTDPQYRYIIHHTDIITSDKKVDYCAFIKYYAPTSKEPEKWMTSMQKAVVSNEPAYPHQLQPMPLHEVQERLRQSVMAHFYSLAQEFAEIDYARIDVVSKEDFRKILHKHVFRITDNQFEKLWGVLPVNEFDNLNYIEFLKLYSSEQINPEHNSYDREAKQSTSLAIDRPQTALSVFRPKTSMAIPQCTGALTRSVTRLSSTSMVNAKSIEQEIQDKIFHNWKDIQRQCRLYDPQNTGNISVYKFRDVMANKNIIVSDDQFHKLVLKYDLNGTGQLSYVDFLRHFILTLKPQEAKLESRPKICRSRSTMIPGETSKEFYETMLRVHDCVSTKWKDMRREFRSLDTQGVGVVSALEFRQVLKQYKINLSEDELYQMMTYYDYSMSGSVRYNDFLRAFLKE